MGALPPPSAPPEFSCQDEGTRWLSSLRGIPFIFPKIRKKTSVYSAASANGAPPARRWAMRSSRCFAAFCVELLDRAEAADGERQFGQRHECVHGLGRRPGQELGHVGLVLLDQAALHPPLGGIAENIERRAAQGLEARKHRIEPPDPRAEFALSSGGPAASLPGSSGGARWYFSLKSPSNSSRALASVSRCRRATSYSSL
jgi:hypothetical protein